MSYSNTEEGCSLIAEHGEEQVFVTRPLKKNQWCRYMAICGVVLLAGLGFGTLLGQHLHATTAPSPVLPEHHSCKNPVIRREWRSLSMSEKHQYLNAVQCLKEIPSRIGEAQSLYDDFPWIHYRIGDYSHHAAAFLSWHRSFIYAYERALRGDCNYQGHLIYWDWTLDWQDIREAPIWTSKYGFGTNGDANVGENIVGGHCVTDGPFSHFEIPYIDDEYHPHCLSRGFLDGEKLHGLGEWFRPSVIDELMELDDYEEFLLRLEDGPHIAIPRSIRGDFAMLTAPSDPVFFLHHTQLDRLWWIWQQRDPKRRLWQYHGAYEHNSTVQASLDDSLPLGGLEEDLMARQVMETESDLLCYRY